MPNLELNPAPVALSFDGSSAKVLQAVLGGCKSDHTRRSYEKSISALEEFAEGRPVTRHLLLDWRRTLDRTGLAVGTINVRLTAVRRLVRETRRQRLIGADDDAAELLDVQNLPDRGIRRGNWLDVDQARRLLAVPDRTTMRGRRNYCILAILLGCGLRRSELVSLTVDHLRKREERWIFENIQGKGRKVRSVAIPTFAEEAVIDWLHATKIRSGLIIRRLDLNPEGLSEDTVMDVVSKAAAQIGVPDFAPHDLRRTCAKLARASGGDLEQIQMMLGHASLVTTERYLGGKQNLRNAVNDHLGF